MDPGRGSRGGRLGLQLQQLGLQSGRYILLSLSFYNRCLPGEGGGHEIKHGTRGTANNSVYFNIGPTGSQQIMNVTRMPMW